MTGEGGGRVVAFAHDRRPLDSQRGATSVDMSHQFRAGQTVRLLRNSLRTAAGGEFKVVHPLPDEGRETQYGIKSVREPHERVVKESDPSKDSRQRLRFTERLGEGTDQRPGKGRGLARGHMEP